jgi:hypothetical protein
LLTPGKALIINITHLFGGYREINGLTIADRLINKTEHSLNIKFCGFMADDVADKALRALRTVTEG